MKLEVWNSVGLFNHLNCESLIGQSALKQFSVRTDEAREELEKLAFRSPLKKKGLTLPSCLQRDSSTRRFPAVPKAFELWPGTASPDFGL